MGGRLEGKVAVVTGAGSGIGAASARALAREGARVVAFDLDGAAAEALAAGIVAAGGAALAVQGDVSAAADVRRMAAAALEQFDAVDVLACVAGIGGGIAFEEITEDAWDRVLDVNLKGTFLCCQAVLPLMKARRAGKIVLMGSIAGRATSTFGGAHYTASKAGLLGLMRHLAREAAPFGVNVNAVNPGKIRTPLADTVAPERLAEVVAAIGLGRMGTPEEVADLVVFLASDAASYVTGAAVDIHGGEMYVA